MPEPERDNTTFTMAQVCRRPRAMAITVFFCVFLVLFKICLISMIRINAATVCDYDFHWWAMGLLLQTRELLKMKDAG